MRQTFSILFFLKRRQKTDNNLQRIIVRITANGESSEFSTHLKCCSKDWNSKNQCVKGRKPESTIFNNALYDIRARIHSFYHQQVLHGDSSSPQTIKDIYFDESRTKYHLQSFFEIHNENIRLQIGKGRSKATYQKYEVTRKHLKGYLKKNHSLDDILICKVDHQFIWEFEIYLKTVANSSHNTTAKFMQFFKRIIRLAFYSHYIKEDPFMNYEIKLQEVHRGYLTVEELSLIITKKLILL